MEEDVPEAAHINFRQYQPHSNQPSQPYYVQSPSPHSGHHQFSPPPQTLPEPSRFSLSILSRYSSSRSSTTTSEKPSAHFKTRVSAAVADVGDEEAEEEGGRIITVRDILVKNEYEDEDEREYCYYERKRRGCVRVLTIGKNSSNAWICLQIGVRLVISFSLALLVFYVATAPPRPTVSIQMDGISEFELGEGADRTGIPTKILSCNSSIHLLVENKSKVFTLHLRHARISLYFDRILLAASQGFGDETMNVESYETALFKMSVATRQKPMYGAGRKMEDTLESGKGLPLTIKLSMKSCFRVLGKIINPKFHHKAQCDVILSSHYNKKLHSQSLNSFCKVTR